MTDWWNELFAGGVVVGVLMLGAYLWVLFAVMFLLAFGARSIVTWSIYALTRERYDALVELRGDTTREFQRMTAYRLAATSQHMLNVAGISAGHDVVGTLLPGHQCEALVAEAVNRWVASKYALIADAPSRMRFVMAVEEKLIDADPEIELRMPDMADARTQGKKNETAVDAAGDTP